VDYTKLGSARTGFRFLPSLVPFTRFFFYAPSGALAVPFRSPLFNLGGSLHRSKVTSLGFTSEATFALDVRFLSSTRARRFPDLHPSFLLDWTPEPRLDPSPGRSRNPIKEPNSCPQSRDPPRFSFCFSCPSFPRLHVLPPTFSKVKTS